MLNTETNEPAGTQTKDVPEEAQPARGKAKPGRKRRVFAAVAVVALLAGATAVGTTLPDPKSSDAYAALAGEKASVESERDSAKSSYESMKSKYDTLQNGIAAREAKVTARETEVGKADAAVKTAEAEVKKREEAVTGAEKTKAANTIGDGTWTVGTDIETGNLPGGSRRRLLLLLGHLRHRKQRQQHHRQRSPRRRPALRCPVRRPGLQVQPVRRMGKAVAAPDATSFIHP